MTRAKENYKKNWLKFSLALVVCLLVRLIPMRVPNIEPIVGTLMPIGRAYGAFVGFSFAILSVFFYDVLTGTLGIHTFFTAGAFGALSLWAVYYFEKNRANKWSYVRFAVMGTLFFDAITGLVIGPLLFGQPFINALMGQIPFTLLHLSGNITFAFFLSPIIYNFLIKERKKERSPFINILNPNTV